MSSVTQPDVTNAQGVALTVGIMSGVDRTAIVLPLGLDADPEANTICSDAVQSFLAAVTPDLQAVLSTDNYISFIQADGMQDGRVPYRQDFAPSDLPGGRGHGSVSSQVAALMYFYRDEDTAPANSRVRIAKNFIPGLCPADVVGDLIVADLFTAIQTLATLLQNGFPSIANSGKNWYRYLAIPKTRTTDVHLIPTFVCGVRNYVGTQRRRLIPH